MYPNNIDIKDTNSLKFVFIWQAYDNQFNER